MNANEYRLRFEEIMTIHKGIVFKVAITYCPHEEDRQDLIQEIMIQIWQSLHKYNNEFSITTWLYRLSLNVAISFYRKSMSRNKHNTPLTDLTYQVKENEQSDKEQQMALLEQFISNLKELDKALMLLYLEEKSYKEIADILGISKTNVATKIGRIKTSLKQQFKNH